MLPLRLVLVCLVQGVFGLGDQSSTSNAQSCSNGPKTRNCWTDGFDIDTNADQSWPNTGALRSYDFTITNSTCNPDGHTGKAKYCQLVNGQYPGPVIHVNWGDKVRVTIRNRLQNNGTSIHWHGIRQVRNSQQDGTNGITECPIAPGASRVYEWQATQYGTSWYHSHHTVQYGEGLLGPIIIDGPATANYDEDLGVLPLSDWVYDQAFSLIPSVNHGLGILPIPHTVLVNGTMVNDSGGGRYTVLNVQKGKTYRLRLINTAVHHFFHVSLDSHPLTVIGADLVPVKPYQTTDLKMNIGQRYDVVFTANRDISNFWLRVSPGAPICGRAQIYGNSRIVVGAIIRYEGAPPSNPRSNEYSRATTCIDEVFTPYQRTSIPRDKLESQLKSIDITLGRAAGNVVTWLINGTSMHVDLEKPTMDYVKNGDFSSLLALRNVVELPKQNEWYFWIIQSALGPPLAHPIHLHGHDFFVLGSGVGRFPNSISSLRFDNVMRRDTATVPGSIFGGWLVVAFQSDNPGAWLMHCHTVWHSVQNFHMQFLERKSEINETVSSWEQLDQGCAQWSSYWRSGARLGVLEDGGL